MTFTRTFSDQHEHRNTVLIGKCININLWLLHDWLLHHHAAGLGSFKGGLLGLLLLFEHVLLGFLLVFKDLLLLFWATIHGHASLWVQLWGSHHCLLGDHGWAAEGAWEGGSSEWGGTGSLGLLHDLGGSSLLLSESGVGLWLSEWLAGGWVDQWLSGDWVDWGLVALASDWVDWWSPWVGAGLSSSGNSSLMGSLGGVLWSLEWLSGGWVDQRHASNWVYWSGVWESGSWVNEDLLWLLTTLHWLTGQWVEHNARLAPINRTIGTKVHKVKVVIFVALEEETSGVLDEDISLSVWDLYGEGLHILFKIYYNLRISLIYNQSSF